MTARHDRRGCLLNPGATVLTRPAKCPRPPPPLPSGRPYTPVPQPIHEAHFDEASTKVHSRSPVRSSPHR
jgi:hypothetical protein